MHSSSFGSLERLSWRDHIDGSLWVDLSMTDKLATMAPKLKTLDVDPSTLQPPSDQLENLLGNISTLTVDCVNRREGKIPQTRMQHLKHLSISRNLKREPDDEDTLGLRTLVAPRLSSLHLRGEFTFGGFFTPEVLQRITHLSLDQFCTTSQGFLVLPSLKSLTVSGNSLPVVHSITAENLDELRVDIAHDFVTLRTSRKTTIQPRIVRINVECEPKQWVSLVYSACIWSRVEGIHLIFFDGITGIPVLFGHWLSGDDKQSPRFPLLHTFTVRYYDGGQTISSKSQREQNVLHLQSLKRSRTRLGGSNLGRLEVGWHCAKNDYRAMGDCMPEWWMTEWKD